MPTTTTTEMANWTTRVTRLRRRFLRSLAAGASARASVTVIGSTTPLAHHVVEPEDSPRVPQCGSPSVRRPSLGPLRDRPRAVTVQDARPERVDVGEDGPMLREVTCRCGWRCRA